MVEKDVWMRTVKRSLDFFTKIVGTFTRGSMNFDFQYIFILWKMSGYFCEDQKIDTMENIFIKLHAICIFDFFQ